MRCACQTVWLWLILGLQVSAAGCSSPALRLVPHQTGVDISVHLPDAAQVLFASSRDGYQWHDARERGGGQWRVTVPGRGEFRYFFMVDGALHIPACPLREYDDFGMENCIYRE